jgi:tight adherence protein C
VITLLVGTAPVVGVAVMALAAALGVGCWALLSAPRQERQVLVNLQRGLVSSTTAESEPAESAVSRLQKIAERITPAAQVRRLEKLYLKAGRPAAWPVARLLMAKLVLVTAALALSALYLTSVPAGSLAVLVAGGAVVVCYFLPELLLHSRGQERSQRIGLELADTMDQMTIAVEAGLGFDAALSRAARNGTGPLAEELVRSLQEIQMGKSRREVFESLGARADVPDLRRFLRAILQAEAYGVAVADVLRTQAGEMRLKRRQRAEEKAMQIPVKVIFPLMFCILPVLFIVLLGPAALDMVAAFK